jgi:hypothetical protein
MSVLSSAHEIPADHLKTGSALPGSVCQVGADGNAAFLPAGAASALAHQTLFVAEDGNDVTGNGSLGAPFATYNKAQQVAYASSTPASDTPWLVVFSPGGYVENIELQGNVFITSWDTSENSLFLLGTITLGSTFATGIAEGAISNAVIQGNINFAFNPSFGQGVELWGCFIDGSGTATGGGPGQSEVFLFNTVTTAEFTATDVNVYLVSSSLLSLTLIALNFTATLEAFYSGGSIGTLVMEGGTAGHTCSAQNVSEAIGNLTLSGTLATYTGTIDGSIPYEPNQPVLTGGALISQYTILGKVPAGNVAPSVWVSLAAGGTLAPSPTQTKIVFDTTGAAGVVNLPASGTAADGEEHLVKGRGATVTGSMTLNAGAGNSIESYASPGTFSGAGGAAVIATTVHPGWIASYKYQASNSEWILQGIY